MSELDQLEQQAQAPATAPERVTTSEEPNLGSNARQAGQRLNQFIDWLVPVYRTPDAVAYSLARNTPRLLLICFALLFASLVASQLNIWTAGYLWGIPCLGAAGLGGALWIWSSNLVLWPGLSEDARAALRRAARLQISVVVCSGAALLYFFGMAVGLW